MALAVGDLIGGKYRILKRLGRGGLGDVYLAEDRLLARRVAIKHLRPGSAREQADIEHFLAEARIIACIQHENVVAIYDAIKDEKEGNYFLVMEYADRGTLADLLQREGQLPVLEALELGLAVARALEAVHTEGILHRDIKPSNIMLIGSQDGVKAKLADFGLSRVMTEVGTDQATFSGSILYSAPEQLRGEAIDHRADLYALGAVLYEMLTGQPPFPYTGDPEDVMQVIQSHLEDPPPMPSQLNPDISPVVAELLCTGLKKVQDERYPDALSLGQALCQAIEAHRAWQERVRTNYVRGVEHERQGDWGQAIACYEAVIAEQPGHAEAKERLAQAREKQDWEARYGEGLQTYDQGQWAEAERIFLQIVAHDRGYAGGDAADKLDEVRRQLSLCKLYKEAKGYEKEERWSEAVDLYIKILMEDSDYEDVSAQLAHAVEQQKRQTLYNQAREHLENQAWADAVKTLQELERLRPVYKDSADLLVEAKRQKRLHERYTEAVRALNSGEWVSAIEAFRDVLRLDPEYRDAAIKRAIAEHQEELAQLYKQAKEQVEAERWSAAAATLQEMRVIAPSYKDVGELLKETLQKQRIADLYHKGMELFEQREWEQAIQRLEEVNRLQPDYRDVEQTLEEARSAQRIHALYAQARQFEVGEEWAEAIRVYSDVVRLVPNHREAKVGLQRVTAALGREGSSDTERRERIIAGVIVLLVIVVLGIMFSEPLSRMAVAVFPSPTPTSKPATLCNGDFENSFECWQCGGDLDQDVHCAGEGCCLVLGNPNYPCYGGVPVGEAWTKQTFRVPQVTSPMLSLRYRVFSQDLDLSGYDYFQVAINGEPLPETYGNYEWNAPSCDREPWDSQWQTLSLDLSDYRGEEIEVSFHNVNGTQPYYNTWTYIDDVRID